MDLTMEQVRALDNEDLRRVVAELVGYRVVPCLEASNAGLFRVVYGDQEAEWCGRSVEEAWGVSLMGVETELNIPDYVRDLNAAVALLTVGFGLHRWDSEVLYECRLDRAILEPEQAETPARAVCLAWVAWRLVERKKEQEHSDD
jgi:hypothetical protein